MRRASSSVRSVIVAAQRSASSTPALLRWGWPRWFDLAPEVVLAAGLSLFLVAETEAATSSFKSSRAVAIMIVTALAWLVARATSARVVPWSVVRVGVFSVAALAILKVVVLPSFRDTTVIETFPVAAATTAPSGAITVPSSVVPPATTVAATASPATDAPTASAPATAVAATPVAVRSGSFTGIDHRAEGAVRIYHQPDGTYVVGLEDIDIQPGPDYDVYIVPGADQRDRGGAIRLDDLRGNQGTQFYVVPPGPALEDGPWTVLVWCQTFGVPIAHATPV